MAERDDRYRRWVHRRSHWEFPGYSSTNFSRDTIRLSIAGACRNNGSPSACAGYGVFFGQGNPHNEYGEFDGGGRATNQRAELWAAIRALRVVQRLETRWRSITEDLFGYGDEDELCNVIVYSHSEYVVTGITGWIHRWRSNGWINSKGRTMANQDLFQKLDNMVKTLGGKKVTVMFRRVPREENQDAADLARRIF